MTYLAEVPFTISGIPCLLGVTYCVQVKGDRNTWDSDMDFYGYSECEYEVLDRKGYRAKWLEKKAFHNEDAEEAIYQHFRDIKNARDPV